MKPAWTANSVLPGGENYDPQRLLATYRARFPSLDVSLIKRWMHNYGSNINKLLEHVSNQSELGHKFADDLYQVEVDYLIDHEFALNAKDILYRRSKLHLLINDEQVEAELQRYIESRDNHNVESMQQYA